MNFWEKKLFYKKKQRRWLLFSVIESSIQKYTFLNSLKNCHLVIDQKVKK